MSKQTLEQAIHLAKTGKSKSLASAARCLDGKPVGGWGDTQEAMRDLRNELPLRSQRAYTIDQFIRAAYSVSSDRYHTRLA